MTLVLDPKSFTDKGLASLIGSTARINIWHGSVRSTKTINANFRWLDYVARDAPEGPLLFGGKTKDTIVRNVIDPMQQVVGHRALRVVGNNAYLFGRKIHIISGNDEGSEKRVQGLTLAGAYLDEISTLPEGYFKMVLSRLSTPGSKLFGTTNPDSPNHWLKTEFLDKEAELNAVARPFGQVGLRQFHFNLDDNPHLDPAYVASLKAEYGGPGTLFYMRFIDGRWVLAEGAIYDMWQESLHVTPFLPPPEDVARAWLGIDYGTSNPFVALLLLHVTKPVDHILVAREWRWDSKRRNRQLTDAEYSEALALWLSSPECAPYVQPARDLPSGNLERIYVDPSAASFQRQLHVDGFHGVNGANNDVLDGIRAVASLRARRLLLVHDSCDGLKEEIPSYVWDPKQQAKGQDAPNKENDHGPDAERYGIASARTIWRHWLEQGESAQTG